MVPSTECGKLFLALITFPTHTVGQPVLLEVRILILLWSLKFLICPFQSRQQTQIMFNLQTDYYKFLISRASTTLQAWTQWIPWPIDYAWHTSKALFCYKVWQNAVRVLNCKWLHTQCYKVWTVVGTYSTKLKRTRVTELLTDPRLSSMFLILVSTLGSVRSWWEEAAAPALLPREDSWEEADASLIWLASLTS